MTTAYPTLLSPILRRGFVIRNRMGLSRCYPPFSTGVESREPLRSVITYAGNLAKNGAAIVTLPSTRWQSRDDRPMDGPFPGMPMGEMDMDPPGPFEPQEGPPAPGSMSGPDLTIANVKLTYIHSVQAIHDAGSLAVISLMEVEPSGWDINDISAEALGRLTDDFAVRCRQYQKLGFDGCGFYMCYRSSLMSKALSPDLNRRTDRYGDPAALALEAFQKVRMACGEHFLIEIEISGADIPGGYTTEQLGAYLKTWAPYIDIVQVRGPTVELAHPIGANSTAQAPLTLGYAKALKAMGTGLLIAPVGGFQSPERNEAFLAQGDADMIYMARAFLCDSRYYEKILANQGGDVTPCIRCNKCHTKPAEPNPGCSVNPLLSLSVLPGFHRPKKAETPRRVAVIGGGPAGMYAAITAADLGHQVTLYEQSSELGGQLIPAGTADFKWPVRDFLLHLRRQVGQSNVRVLRNTRATPELLAPEGYEAILLAAGATPKLPDIPRAELARTAISVYGNCDGLGQNIVVIGGSETGLETAMYLAKTGRQVTLLTRKAQVAPDSHDVHYREILDEFWKSLPNLTVINRAVTQAITPHAVCYTRKGEMAELPCDDVIALGGMESCQDQVTGFAALTPRFRVIGDCRTVGDIRRAVRDGYTAAIEI